MIDFALLEDLTLLRETVSLKSTGAGRGAVYHLPASALAAPDEVFGPTPMLQLGSSSDLRGSSSVLGDSSLVLEGSSSDLTPMVRNKTLSLAFPATPTHERQASCTTHTLPNTLGNK